MTATGTTDQAAQTRSIRGERPVPFEDVMAAVGRWMVATEALAAAGAELALAGPQDGGDPDVTAAVRGVCPRRRACRRWASCLRRSARSSPR